MTLFQAMLLFASAILGGAINSVAGGGTFFTFPTLVFTGVPEVSANVTNTVALWPGSAASVGAYRRELATQRSMLPMLSIVSVVGALIGGVLLLVTSNEVFAALVPWLLLFATLIFSFSAPLTRWMRAHFPASERPSLARRLSTPLFQLIIAIYGGFFGGGIGILMLATLSLMGMENIHEMNAVKTLLATVINGAAVVLFVFAGVVVWPAALVMIVGAVLGGYGGAAIARKIDPKLVRRFVIISGFVLTAIFFARTYAFF